ncbi:MAG TPA: hypothetical protein PKD85_20245, partial [Saprospiraceae bacterium]|nr:hypothetical protein [Saprospiraceae bacterium]
MRAKNKAIWGKLTKDLVEKSRISMGRSTNPSYSLIDSQSVKTTDKAEKRGINGGKKLKAERDILLQTHKVICCTSRCMKQTL